MHKYIDPGEFELFIQACDAVYGVIKRTYLATAPKKEKISLRNNFNLLGLVNSVDPENRGDIKGSQELLAIIFKFFSIAYPKIRLI